MVGRMARDERTEYGGSDTRKTDGIQPPPHVPTPDEQLRLTYKEDPADAGTERP